MRRELAAACVVLMMTSAACSASSSRDPAGPTCTEALTSPAASPEPSPVARFARTTTSQTSLAGSTAALDLCARPVAVALGADRPVLVADAVALDGSGVDVYT